jgi:hypothetical protein
VDIPQKRRSSIVAVLNLIWPSLLAQTFKVFSCRNVCGNGLFLRADIDEHCFKDRHLLYVVLVGVPMMLGYVFGFPLAALVATRKLQLRSARKEKKVSDSKGFKTWGAFFSMYKQKVWWWEGTVALRKIVIAMIGVFGSDMGQMQIQLTLMLVFLVVVMTATVQPFSDELKQQHTLQSLEMASLMAIFLTLWAGSVFFTFPKCEDPQMGQGKTLAWCDVLSVTVGLTDFIILLTLVVYFLSVKFSGKGAGEVIGGAGGVIGTSLFRADRKSVV